MRLLHSKTAIKAGASLWIPVERGAVHSQIWQKTKPTVSAIAVIKTQPKI
jgi:hypothetical protein